MSLERDLEQLRGVAAAGTDQVLAAALGDVPTALRLADLLGAVSSASSALEVRGVGRRERVGMIVGMVAGHLAVEEDSPGASSDRSDG